MKGFFALLPALAALAACGRDEGVLADPRYVVVQSVTDGPATLRCGGVPGTAARACRVSFAAGEDGGDGRAEISFAWTKGSYDTQVLLTCRDQGRSTDASGTLTVQGEGGFDVRPAGQWSKRFDGMHGDRAEALLLDRRPFRFAVTCPSGPIDGSVALMPSAPQALVDAARAYVGSDEPVHEATGSPQGEARPVLARTDIPLPDWRGPDEDGEQPVRPPTEAPLPPGRNGCPDMPYPVGVKAIVAYAVEGGGKLSTANLDGRTDTGLVEVVVEEGEGSLYFVLSAREPTIWRFGGAVGRVAQAVVLAAPSATGASHGGAAGLMPDQVSFADGGTCLVGDADRAKAGAGAYAASLWRLLGRLDGLGGGGRPARVGLPSGQVVEQALPEAGGTEEDALERQVRAVHPGGVAAIETEAVLSAASVGRTALLPGAAGLWQLVRAGRIEPRGRAGYRIKGPLARLPQGGAALAARYLLPQGTPLPETAACVVDEGTGRPLANAAACP